MNFSTEQWHFIAQVLIAVTSTGILGFFGLAWKFFKAVNEVPRIRKGVRILFERIEKIEKELEDKL